MAVRKSLFLIAIYFGALALMMVPVEEVEAQSPTPMITMTCNDMAMTVDVEPGSTRTGSTMCTLENPTAYDEMVRITITAEGLTTAAPGAVGVGAGQDADFPVSVRAPLRAAEGSFQVRVRAEVTHINGMTSPQSASQELNMMIIIKQFARLQLSAEEPFTQLQPKVDYTFTFNVYNQGNAIDKVRLEIADQNMETLRDAGFQVTLPEVSTEIDPQPTPKKVRIQIRTPKNQGWTDEYYQLEFKVSSDFAVREGDSVAESQMITIYVRGVYMPGFELIPTLSMVALAAAVAFRRINRESDEIEESTEFLEAAPGL